jgi:glutaconate CoA-transferase subunit A
MSASESKIYTLSRAVDTFVKSGDHISLGGFTINRNPMAAVHEIIRQEKTGLHLYAHSNGQALDELVGAGCVRRVEAAYCGNGRFAPTCICFKRKCRNREILVEDYTNYQMALRFLAGSMGVPFLPTRSSLGSDVLCEQGFDERVRAGDPAIPSAKLAVMEDPFADPKSKADRLVLVPAVNPDVTVIHAQRADKHGYAAMEGLTFSDAEQVKAARKVIVTCEEIVDSQIFKGRPETVNIQGFCVDAVVEVPFGAYPTACYRYYDYDPVFLDWYKGMAADPEDFSGYVEEYIKKNRNHEDFMEKALAGKSPAALLADPEKGYSVNIRRKA